MAGSGINCRWLRGWQSWHKKFSRAGIGIPKGLVLRRVATGCRVTGFIYGGCVLQGGDESRLI